jgi:hypothetical protein
MTSPFAEAMRRIRHFGDYVTVPLAAVILMDLAGRDRLYLVLLGLAAWTLLEYLVHRLSSIGFLPSAKGSISFIMTIQTTPTPNDRASVRRCWPFRLDIC